MIKVFDKCLGAFTYPPLVDRMAGFARQFDNFAVFYGSQYAGLQPATKAKGTFDFGIIYIRHSFLLPEDNLN